MKTKNVILGIVAFVMAMGSALAAKYYASQNAFIEVRLTSTSDWSCQDSGVTCDDEGDQACTISIVTTADGQENVQGKLAGLGQTCGAALVHTSSAAQESNASVYDAR